MSDSRITKLAENLVNYSCRVKPGERVLIETSGFELPLTKELIKQIYKAGGLPFVQIGNDEIKRSILKECTEEQVKLMASIDLIRMKEMNAYIGLRCGENASELGDVPPDKMDLFDALHWQPVHVEQRAEHTKWVVLRYPNHSMAQLAGMSTEAFEDYYYKVCNLDYARMAKAMEKLTAVMNKADKVRITGKDTQLSFSMKGLPAFSSAGDHNIPDGEVFSAPVRNSVNGYITYNVPSRYQGYTFDNVRLEFEDGKIVKATANDTERINSLLDIDEGARYIGEFAFGINPYIEKPINDIHFDEKIQGSIHFTPGSYCEPCDNGNRSALHWDLVCIQRKEYGGGEIWFDDVLIRKDGLFVLEELKCLNPENLV